MPRARCSTGMTGMSGRVIGDFADLWIQNGQALPDLGHALFRLGTQLDSSDGLPKRDK